LRRLVENNDYAENGDWDKSEFGPTEAHFDKTWNLKDFELIKY